MRIALAVALSVGAAATALAADVPAQPPPPVYVPVPPSLYDWTGIYFGANLGAGWSRGNFSDTAGNTFTTTGNSQFLGGGQLARFSEIAMEKINGARSRTGHRRG